MRSNTNFLLAYIFICIFMLSCSNEDFNLSDAREDHVSSSDGDKILKFIYKGVIYESSLDLSDSEVFFSDHEVEVLYKKFLQKPNVFINVKSEDFWELYDSEEEYSLQSKVASPLLSTKVLGVMEPEVFLSHVWMYENIGLSGACVEWVPRVHDSGGYIEGSVKFVDTNFNKKLSSFQINNQSYYYQLRARFINSYTNGPDWSKSIIINVEPRATFITLSIAKTFGKKKDNQAEYATFGFYKSASPVIPADEYDIDNIVYYRTDVFSERNVILSRYTQHYSSQTYSVLMDVTAKLTNRVYFGTADNKIKVNEIGITEVGIPSIMDGSIYIDRKTSKDWAFKLFSNQTNLKFLDVKKNIIVPSRTNCEAVLLCKEYSVIVAYRVYLRKKATNIQYTLDGKFEATLQQDPYIILQPLGGIPSRPVSK